MILTPEGCIYHLNIRPEHLADTIILVGDPDRVPVVSAFFDEIEFRGQNREIVTHTGYYKQRRLTVMSTGMGPDNIDIVINELDALVNIDLERKLPKERLKSLKIIRLGTSGAVQPDIEVDRFAIAEYALGLDGLLHFYGDVDKVIAQPLTTDFIRHFRAPEDTPTPYIVSCFPELSHLFDPDWLRGITVTAPGFYGPQGRSLRLPLSNPDLIDQLSAFKAGDLRIINFEMESSGIYGLCKLMGHQCLTICVIVANRINSAYSKDYHASMKKLIREVLDKIVQ